MIFAAVMAINTIISEEFNGVIWRLEIDEVQDLMLVEVRNNQEKAVSFSSIGLHSGVVNFRDFTTPELWLTGMESAFDGVLLLHYYQSEDGPAHKGLLAVDATNGQILWSNYAYAFDHLSVKGPVVFDTRMQPRKLFLADIKTGNAQIIQEGTAEAVQQIGWPALMTTGELPAWLAAFNPVENTVYCLEHDNYKIVSLHAIRDGQLVQAIYIFHGTALLYEDLLNTGIQKIQPEAFILHKNRLIYVKNRRQLVIISL